MLNPGRLSRRVPLSSVVPTVWRNATTAAITVRLVADVPFHVVRVRDHTPTDATVQDLMVPAMAPVTLVVEPKEHLSFLAYDSLVVDGTRPRFQVEGDYVLEGFPAEHKTGAVWVRCDGLVWASEVR